MKMKIGSCAAVGTGPSAADRRVRPCGVPLQPLCVVRDDRHDPPVSTADAKQRRRRYSIPIRDRRVEALALSRNSSGQLPLGVGL